MSNAEEAPYSKGGTPWESVERNIIAADNFRRLSENALLPKLFVILKKIILGISTIYLWLFFQVFLDFEQNCYSRTAS